jgi:hypothetical protein
VRTHREELRELALIEHKKLHRRIGNDGGVAGCVIEERHLAGDRARADDAYRLPVARRNGDAREGHEALLSVCSFAREDPAGCHVDLRSQRIDPCEFIVGAVSKE